MPCRTRTAHLGCCQLLHDPAVDVAQHLGRQIVAARILPQADRHASRIEQPQVFANPLRRIAPAFTAGGQQPASGRGRRTNCASGLKPSGNGPPSESAPAKTSGRFRAMRKAIVPPQPNPAKKIRRSGNVHGSLGMSPRPPALDSRPAEYALPFAPRHSRVGRLRRRDRTRFPRPWTARQRYRRPCGHRHVAAARVRRAGLHAT